MKHRVFLIAIALCAAVMTLHAAGCGKDAEPPKQTAPVKQSDRDTSSTPVQTAARPDLNDPEVRAELIENLSGCFRFWASRDVIKYDENGKRLTPTPGESLEEWRQAKGLTKEDMTDIFAGIIRERLAELETGSDTGKLPVMYSSAQYYLKNYPLPQEEFMALVRKTVDLDPEHAGNLVKSYIETYPDWVFDDGTFVEIAERIHSDTMDVDTLLINMYNQVVKELDRLLLDGYDKDYATNPGRKLQLEKDLKRHEEAEIYDWVYRRTKYALEHFGEGNEAFEMLYKMDTDPKLQDGEWERSERKRRVREAVEEMKKAGKDPGSVFSKEYLEEIYSDE